MGRGVLAESLHLVDRPMDAVQGGKAVFASRFHPFAFIVENVILMHIIRVAYNVVISL